MEYSILQMMLTPMYTDYETDTVIQTSLRKELPKDVTLLVIAHRLQTIMDADRIVRTSAQMLLIGSVTKQMCIHRWFWMRAVS